MGAEDQLRDFQPRHDYLIAIDSDGCAFDSMEIKHKECFIPNIIKYWELQPVSKYARAVAEFVNLYSKWRGLNRFPALVKVFDLLRDWPVVLKRSVEIPVAKPLRDWIEKESKLGNPALEEEVKNTGNPILEQTLLWSEAVNRSVAEMVHGIPPFPLVKESLDNVSHWADIIVCSGTPGEALRREWTEHNLAQYVRVIAGQEVGSKKEHIQSVARGNYALERILMIGDAPGDREAAKANGAHFFPINPGEEERSWELFYEETAHRFQSGEYESEYEASLISDFEKRLPEIPPWKEE